MYSTMLYNISTIGYIISLAVSGVNLLNNKKNILKTSIIMIALSFLIQTFGMLCRWAEAGELEVSAAEKALGQEITGYSWWVIFSQHPPWSNLYEIMIYMSWGIVLVTLICEIKWKLPLLNKIGLLLALLALGIASLTDSSIKPLVPALKSWWIMIHVISASIAYAFGFIASFMCFFALLKDEKRISLSSLVGGFLISMAMLIFALTGGFRLFLEQAYFVKLLSYTGNALSLVYDLANNSNKAYLVPMPYVSYPFIFAIIIHALFAVLIIVFKEYYKTFFILCFLSSLLPMLIILFNNINKIIINITMEQSHHLSLPAPYYVSFISHPWSFGLFIFVFLLEILFLLFLLKKESFIKMLPSVSSLEEMSYKSISFAFFLMTIVLITGALWAHYAWGRYWAWDPKETGALAIWLIYAVFLHTKKTQGLSGPISSFIGVLGLFVIIIGFLGVNLGLFADGLHTYGNS